MSRSDCIAITAVARKCNLCGKIRFSDPKPKATTARSTSSSTRQGPLHACGVSIFAIADIAFAKTQQINGPFGSSLRRVTNLAKFATPLITALQCQFLVILSLVDDRIIGAEKIAEKVFPPAHHVFDKMHELIPTVVDSLPTKFDGAVNKFPEIVHKVPLMERALTLFVSSLDSLASKVDRFFGPVDQDSSSTREKTIGVDRDFNDHMDSSSKYIRMDSLESFPPISEVSSTEAEKKGAMEVSSHAKVSYKEVLERDLNEKKVDDDGGEMCEVNNNEGAGVEKGDGSGGGSGGGGGGEEESEGVEECQVERSESIKGGGDIILTLFDSWLMDTGRF